MQFAYVYRFTCCVRVSDVFRYKHACAVRVRPDEDTVHDEESLVHRNVATRMGSDLAGYGRGGLLRKLDIIWQ